jgi:hypothetical protein
MEWRAGMESLSPSTINVRLSAVRKMIGEARKFGNGFSKSNLEYMRRFDVTYPNRSSQIAQTVSGRFGGLEASLSSPITQTLSGQSVPSSTDLPFALSWSHYVFLLGLNEQERKFYEIEATQQNWTLRDLKR